ncbi:MAG: phytoene desaturase family protein [Myxococcota bacterium]
MSQETPDAIVIGSGPNGLAAAIELARAGADVLVVEAEDEIGGGTRSAELTLPGFNHDICSAVHPMGILSPFYTQLPLEEHGLEWICPPASVAHPLDDGSAVMLYKSVEQTMAELGADGANYRRLVGPFVESAQSLLADVMAPLRIPQNPIQMANFGLRAAFSANRLARILFRDERARALLAGCAGHAVLPLTQPLTAALGVLFMVTGHAENWPVAKGGSSAIPRALGSYFKSLGGRIETGRRISHIGELPSAKAILFDTSPEQLSRIAADVLPDSYRRRLGRYRYGPGVFKLDWALDGPIPWSDPRCLEASTVHIGGTLEEIAASERAMYRGEHHDKPYLILCQQSQFDDSRAPEGKHTGYAYCHVPHGSTLDRTDVIEAQIERFAPGFRDLILERHTMNTMDLERHNPNYKGGAITGGVADAFQLFNSPVTRLDPYSTPNDRLFICSAATPPGGGVHGQCGYWAAQSALKRIR